MALKAFTSEKTTIRVTSLDEMKKISMQLGSLNNKNECRA